MLFLGIDTGGTFTDFVLYDGRSLRIHKVLSTPEAPEKAILQGIAELLEREPEGGDLSVVHGSTVATNAVLEGKGVRTAYVTNYGLGDVLTIGRQARRSLYDLQPPPLQPPVPEELCLETGGRLGADGRVVEPLTGPELESLRATLEQLSPRAVAINLLFSFVDDRFERAIEAIVPEGVFVSRSSEVLPEYKEYERGMATWLNAWVGPLVEGYLRRLSEGLPKARLAVMQSSGETIEARLAGRQAVRLLLSGPAGGLAGARFVASQAGFDRLLTFDMGGTSTDVALIAGEVPLTGEAVIGRYPVAVPMVDMHTVGAGGGSIARIDAGGLLQVGPESAGAFPGPACYGQGGAAATVTDANLLLSRLDPHAFLGGGMALDEAAARAAIAPIAAALNCSLEEAAAGIVRVADEHMARALRVMSVQRGIDPRELTLVCFGGAGGLHVCALAEALGMRRAFVPVHAGVLSALGMLAAPRGRQLSRTVDTLLADCDAAPLERLFDELAADGLAALAEEGVAPEEVVRLASVDVRYRGQSYALNLPWRDPAATTEAFHEAHEERYGHRLDLPVQLVNVRLALKVPARTLDLVRLTSGRGSAPRGQTRMFGIDRAVTVWDGDTLVPGQVVAGPALIVSRVSTTFLADGWRSTCDPYGSLLLERS